MAVKCQGDVYGMSDCSLATAASNNNWSQQLLKGGRRFPGEMA